MDQQTTTSVSRQRRVRTAPLPRLPERALLGPTTLESRVLPLALLLSFGGLLLVQVWKVLL